MSVATLPLGEICTIQGGGTPSRKHPEFYGGNIPWLTVKDLKVHDLIGAQESITEAGVTNSATRVLPPNTVIVATRITVGAVGIARVPVAINQDLKGLTVRHDVSPEYLAWFLRTKQSTLESKASGSTVKGVTNKVLAGLVVPLPPLNEQRRIVNLLDRAAEIRRRADAARAKARAIIPALFLDMFGDPASDWPEATISDILADQDNAIRTGPFGSQLKHSEFTGDGVPVLGIDNVVDNEFKWAKPRHLPLERYETFRRFRVFPGDVIVTIMGTTGRVCVAPDDLPECMNTKHLCAFTLDRSRAHPRFIWGALLFDPGVRAQARGKANGQIMEGWNMGIVRSMRLPLPPLPLQTAFAEQARRIEATARALDTAAARAEAMVASLSAEVFDRTPDRGNSAASATTEERALARAEFEVHRSC